MCSSANDFILLFTTLIIPSPTPFVTGSRGTDVRITLPCTGKASGIAPFRVQLDIRREFEALRKIPRIAFIVHKYCLSAGKQFSVTELRKIPSRFNDPSQK